jgi:hypothetical protein
MAGRHISMRGEVVDFNRLRLATDTKKPALGNASMNARGDIVQRGSIIKTQEQIDAEWEARKAEQESISQPVDLKDQGQMAQAAGSVIPQARQPQKKLDVDDAGFDPAMLAQPTRRRIVDSDE